MCVPVPRPEEEVLDGSSVLRSARHCRADPKRPWLDGLVRRLVVITVAAVALAVGPAGSASASLDAGLSISASGQYVAFESTDPGLVGNDTNAKKDVFVRDAKEKTTERVSIGAAGAQANGESSDASISDDGRYVAFTSVASNLVSGDTNGAADVFVYDRTARTIERASVSDGAGQLAVGGNDAAISGDGRYVAFVTRSPAIGSDGCEDIRSSQEIYLYDRSLKRTVQAVSSQPSDVCGGTRASILATGDGPSLNPSISKDGRFVAFESDATNTVAGDTNGARDIMLRDTSQDGVTRVSVAATGAQANGASTDASISDDGRYVAFASVASNLNPSCCGADDTNAASDIHVRDRGAGTTTWVSRRPLAATPGGSFLPAISGDGTRVSFASDAALQTFPGKEDANGVRDIYQTELAVPQREPALLSFDDDQGFANGASDRPAESGDGTCTAFSSAATSFLPSFMADSNGVVDVYRHCWKQGFKRCSVDRMTEPSYDGRDLPGFYGYDAEGVRPGRVDLCAGDPVNCATGNFFEEQVDFAVGGRGVGLDLVRTYNAQDAGSASTPGPFGFGWSFTFGERLAIDAGSGDVSVHHRDGQVARFERREDVTGSALRADGSYVPERLVQSSLSRDFDGSYTYTLPDQRTFTFNAAGRLTAKADRNANRTALAYDAQGRLSSITDPAGRKLTLAYNAAGTVSQVSDPAGRTVRYAYDAAKNLTGVTDVGAKSWQFAYDSKHRMTTFTNPRGAKTTNVYDSRDRVTVQTDPLGRVTRWAYAGDETRVTDPAGNVTEKRFRSHLPVWIAGAQGTDATAVTRLDYDANANLVKVTDPNDRAWSYGYDGQGNRTEATDPLGNTTTHAYDSRRNVTSLRLPSGRVTSYGYDARSNLVSVRRTLSETGQTPTTTFAYDSLGQLGSVTDPLGRSWRYAYNAQGDPTSATSPAGRKTTATYNTQGWLTSTVSGRGNAVGASPGAYTTTFTRDAYGRATAVRDPLGRSTTMAYDAVGNVTDTTDRDGRRSQSAYDLADREVEVTRGDGSVLKTGYDVNGLVVSQTDGLGRTTGYVRDRLGRVASATDPLGRKTSYAYDRAGNRTGLTDPAGRLTTHGYDDAGRLKSITYSSGAPKPISYSYDADGRLSSMGDGGGTTSFGYDSLGRLVSAGRGRTQTLRYGYDLAGRVTTIAYPDALTGGTGGVDPVGTVTRGYDADGNLTSVGDWLGHTTRFSYDPDGALVRTERPDASVTVLTRDANGLVTDLADTGPVSVLAAATPRTGEGLVASTSESGAAAAAAESFRYDGAARLTAAGPAAASGYGYDAADNPTRLPTGGGVVQGFDAANQLTLPTGGGVVQGFDAANQLTNTTRATDGAPLRSFGYDSDGNRTSSSDQNGTRAVYGYDQADQLTSYSGPDRSRPGQTATAQYSYDATGLRSAKTVNGTVRAQTWDRSGGMPVLIADGPTVYITGPDGRPVEQILQDGSVRYYHQDHHGSTRALTNQTGAIVAKYTYDAYGNPTSPATGVENPFGYDGQQTDPETGHQYLRARHYDPTTAQFLTRDPIADQTRTPYTYANNNPTNHSDPTGLLPDLTPQFVDDGAAAVGNAALVAGEAGGEFAVGALDTPTFGLTSKALGEIGINVDTCSGFYTGGGYAPIGGVLSVLGKGAKLARLGRGVKAADDAASSLPISRLQRARVAAATTHDVVQTRGLRRAQKFGARHPRLVQYQTEIQQLYDLQSRIRNRP